MRVIAPGNTAKIGDTCIRIREGGGTLKQGQIYTITKINKNSARGVREDGVSVNQSFSSIAVVKRGPITKLDILRRLKNIFRCIKHNLT